MILQFLLGLSTSALWLPYLYSPAETPRWAALAICAAIMLLASSWRTRGSEPRATALDYLALGLFGWALVSLFWTPNLRDGIGEALKWLWLACLYVVGRRSFTMRPLIAGAAVGLGVSSVLAVWEVAFGHRPFVAESAAPAGLHVNGITLAGAASVVLVGALAHRMWWAAILVAPAVLLAHSKSAWLALAICGIWALWQTGRPWPTMASFAAIWGAAGAFLLFSDQIMAIGSVTERAMIYRAVGSGISFVGNGLGSLRDQFPLLDHHLDILRWRVDHAHSDWLQIAFELGVPGAMLAVVLLGFAIHRLGHNPYDRWPERWIILVSAAAMVAGLQSRIPLAMALLAFALGRAGRFRSWL